MVKQLISIFLLSVTTFGGSTWISGSAMAWGQESRDLLRNIKNEITSPILIFKGKKITGKRWRISNKSSDVVNEVAFSFSVISERQWRLDLRFLSHNKDVVFARSGDLAFSTQTDRDGIHQYTNVGYDSLTQDELENGALNNCLLLSGLSFVMDLRLTEFLAEQDVKIVSIESVKSSTGKPAEQLKWEWPGDKEVLNRSGELTWLPQNGYLIEKMVFRFLPRMNEGSTVDFSTKVEFDISESGTIFPKRVVDSQRGFQEFVELAETTEAEKDDLFYRPESLGLTSPRNPFLARLFWLVLGIVFIAIAVFFLKWNFQKS